MAVLLATGRAQALHLSVSLQPDKTWLPVDRVLEKPIPLEQLIREIQRLVHERGRKPRTGEQRSPLP